MIFRALTFFRQRRCDHDFVEMDGWHIEAKFCPDCGIDLEKVE